MRPSWQPAARSWRIIASGLTERSGTALPGHRLLIGPGTRISHVCHKATSSDCHGCRVARTGAVSSACSRRMDERQRASRNLRVGSAVDKALCLSYVMGVLDGSRFLDQPLTTPVGATGGQVRDVVSKYLADHPEVREQPARMLVKSAVVDAWPKLQPKPKAAPKAKPKVTKKR